MFKSGRAAKAVEFCNTIAPIATLPIARLNGRDVPLATKVHHSKMAPIQLTLRLCEVFTATTKEPGRPASPIGNQQREALELLAAVILNWSRTVGTIGRRA
jgi:hypothetical protein